jgi:hypothetical protein
VESKKVGDYSKREYYGYFISKETNKDFKLFIMHTNGYGSTWSSSFFVKLDSVKKIKELKTFLGSDYPKGYTDIWLYTSDNGKKLGAFNVE